MQALRPAWWILRAWVGAAAGRPALGDRRRSAWAWSRSRRYQGWGSALLAVAVAGQRPGRPRQAVARSVRGVEPSAGCSCWRLNLAAVACLPADGRPRGDPVERGTAHGQRRASLRPTTRGTPTRAASRPAGAVRQRPLGLQHLPLRRPGRPLVGVQLFDQTGQPVGVTTADRVRLRLPGSPTDQGRVYYPWRTAAGQATNVFPVPSRSRAPARPIPTRPPSPDADRPGVGRSRSTQVPAATAAGARWSARPTTPTTAYLPARSPQLPDQPDRLGC